MLQIESQLLNKDFFIRTLIYNIALYSFGIRIFANRIRIETSCPKVSTPKIFFLHLYASKKSLLLYTLYDCHYAAHCKSWYTLNEKMHMIFFQPYFNKVYFKSFRNFYTNKFQSFRNFICEYLTTIFSRKYESGCKIGVKFPDSILVKKFVALRTFYGNQGTCGMFSGSWNRLRRSEVTPLVIMERSIPIGSRALSRAVRMVSI